MRLQWTSLLFAIVDVACAAFYYIETTDVGKIIDKYPYMCDYIIAKGWLLIAKFNDNIIYVSDLQSWSDDRLDAPQLHLQYNYRADTVLGMPSFSDKGGFVAVKPQPVNQFTDLTAQTLMLRSRSERRQVLFTF